MTANIKELNITPVMNQISVCPTHAKNIVVEYIKCLQAVKTVTGYTYFELMNLCDYSNLKLIDAQHLAMLMIYNETPTTYHSKRQICNLFGRSTASSIEFAQRKMKEREIFRRKYKKVKAEYDRIALVEYDENIPF